MPLGQGTVPQPPLDALDSLLCLFFFPEPRATGVHTLLPSPAITAMCRTEQNPKQKLCDSGQECADAVGQVHPGQLSAKGARRQLCAGQVEGTGQNEVEGLTLRSLKWVLWGEGNRKEGSGHHFGGGCSMMHSF